MENAMILFNDTMNNNNTNISKLMFFWFQAIIKMRRKTIQSYTYITL